MIQVLPNGFMIQSIEELPNFTGAKDLFIDFETTSGNPKKTSLNPWKNCDILGIAITVDECPTGYYLPLRHTNNNLPVDPVYDWLRGVINNGKRWINHNVKYDVQVALNCIGGIVLPDLYDTITLSKLIDSDRLRYNLTDIVKDWLYLDIEPYEKAIHVYTHTPKGVTRNSDYGCIPADVMAPYAITDSLATRALWKYILDNVPNDCGDVFNTEVAVTKVLVAIEQRGLSLNLEKTFEDWWERIPRWLNTIDNALLSRVGEYFRPHVNEDCYRILHVKYGLPVIEWTEGGEPSFGKDALKAYMIYPGAPRNVVRLIMRYRRLFKLRSGFVEPYLELSVKRRLHPNFNQSVRTGRMSCSTPNMQQLSPDAKKYIIPDAGCCLVEFDLKQIEYRYIASYIENASILEEYNRNPNADYHQLMADICGIDRKSAKNMNFAVSFGAGKDKTKLMLKGAFDPKHVPEGKSFDEYCDEKGENIYKAYHERVPELKRSLWQASAILRRRGYVFNAFGRRRNIDKARHFIAFNTVIQSSAADLMKRITLRLQHFPLHCIVHDSWLFNVPLDKEEEMIAEIKATIESTDAKMKVPLYCNYTVSNTNWKDAK